MIGPIEKAGLGLMMFLLMMGMGASLSFQDFKESFKKPKALFIGILSQYGLMPLIGFLLAKVLNLPTEAAISLILVGCTPGGTTSNLFAYLSKANLALSISMTCFSTMVAFVMMPICIKLYISNYTDVGVVIPYKNIITTLVIILIPVLIGMFIKSKNNNAAKKVERVGSITGIVVILFLIITTLARNFDLYKSAGLNYYLGAILLGLFGFLFGYIVSYFLKINLKDRKAISLETGIQNTPLTIALIILSFEAKDQPALLLLPAIYALTIVINSCFVAKYFSKVK